MRYSTTAIPITQEWVSTRSDAGRWMTPKRSRSPSVATVAYRFSPEENPAPSARLNVWSGFTPNHHNRTPHGETPPGGRDHAVIGRLTAFHKPGCDAGVANQP